MNIVLVGFMGTGKTVVAKKVSKKINREYVALDDLIIKREGKPINRIFSEDGEEYFRKIEKKVTIEASNLDNVVIDTGGGVVMDTDNIKNLKRKGLVICLKTSPEVIYERVKNARHRPLLNVENPKQKIDNLISKRASYYAKSDYTIDTSSLTIDEVVHKTINLFKKNNFS